MGRNTQSPREYVKSMEEEILSMHTYMKKGDIEILKTILSMAEKHSNEISNFNQFFAAIIVELYKKMSKYYHSAYNNITLYYLNLSYIIDKYLYIIIFNLCFFPYNKHIV